MKPIYFFAISLLSLVQMTMNAQTESKLYAHKVTVDSAYQTRAYTYLKTRENLSGRDTLLWLALPVIPVTAGETFYYESGMAMGKFTSKELNRTFSQILFLANVSTSAEMNEKNLLPAPPADTASKNQVPPVIHTVVAKEVLPAGGYTYLRVMEGKTELWIAVVKMDAKVGQLYNFEDPAPMKDFYSKELKRTFKEILFLGKLSPGPGPDYEDENIKKAKAVEAKRKEKAMAQPAKTVLSIADLIENKKLYAGKRIQLKGEVTRYNENIMGKNWAHVSDGTRFLGNGDLALTTSSKLKIGDKVTFEGVLSIDKDYGAGYFFEVIIEDAIVDGK